LITPDLMKIRKILACSCAVMCTLISWNASSQDNIGDLLKDEIAESKVLIGEYISPLMKSVSLGLNQGWYNTAKPHKLLGVDLTTSVSVMRIPNSEAYFNVENLGLKHYSLDPDSRDFPNAPTIFGDDRSPSFLYRENPNDPGTEQSFSGPSGLGLKKKIGSNIMPVPMVHLGIGLPKGTDLKIRFVPSIRIGSNGEFNMWGVGVLHDVKQHIPGIKLFPFDLAAFIGHTRMDMEYRQDENEIPGENQRAEMRMSATTIQGLLSKKFSILTLYGGVGVNIAKSTMGLKGTYDINNDGDTLDPNERDPLDLRFAASGVRATAGFRLKLAVFTLHADYTVQKYKALNVGFGISVR
jgi:hypothetical protein